ncbi:MAG: PEP-CTERM sorting domain-containing protein [Phycisphaeraceae bacterium]|nr:PEP-CTERM sorting domain-containing protein [Phycisphaeraceae bacterium]
MPPNAPPPQGALFFVSTSGNAQEGSNFAHLSSWNLQFISQVLPDTVAGTDYELEFWLRRPGPFPPFSAPFRVRWEGQFVFNQLVGGEQLLDWTRFTVPLHSNFSGSLLEFGQSVFPDEWHIDTISVRQVPAPSALPLLALGGAAALRRRRRA